MARWLRPSGSDTTARVEHHLGICRGCAEVLDQWRRTVALTGELGAADVGAADETVLAALVSAFRVARSG